MKKLMCILFFVAPILLFAQTQERIVLDEDFSDNSDGWWVGTNEDVEAEIADGLYIYKPLDYSYIFWDNSHHKHSDEFHIKTSMKIIEGNIEDDYGIYIKDKKYFLINSAKNYKIKIGDNIINQGTCELIKNINNFNELEIIRKGNETRFIINGKQVFATSEYIFNGPKIGWIAYNAKVGIDNIKVTRIPKQYIFKEDYNDNSNEWIDRNTEDYSASISEGNYNIYYKSEGYGHTFYQTLYSFKGDNKYSIETRFKVVSGVDADGFGIYLTNKDDDEEYYYYIKSSGRYKVRYINGENDDVIIDKAVSNDFRNSSEYITLRMEHRKNFLYFYLNNELVDSASYSGFSGNKIGYIIYDKMNVLVDYLYVTVEPDIINLLLNAQKGYKKINLGKNINSVNDELAPEISSDEQQIFFVRETDPSISDMWNKDNQDIFYSEKLSDSTWSEAKNIGRPLNNSGNNFVISVAPDKNTLLLSNAYTADGEPNGEGVSISHKTTNGWTVPEKLNIDNFYNKNDYVSYVLSPDKKVLVLSLQRDDSFGDKDLYVSFSKGNNSWSEPKHMGSVINTYKNEFSPFIAADSKTMYFASYGHPGYGSSDIYVTRRLDDSWLKWTEPQNLGPEINSSDWDAYFKIPANGKVAYIVSYDNSIGNGDIFKISIPEEARPNPVALVKGKVLNAKTKEPIGTQIRYFDLKSNVEAGIASSAPKDGKYSITLPYGKAYSFMAEKEGFYPVSENVDLTYLTEYAEIEKDLLLAPIEKGEIIRLNNIFFETDKSDLLPESYFELDRLIEILSSNKKIKIEISGHTDNRGEEAYNLNLSNLRATSVMNYIVSKNIDASRLVSKGYGEIKPIADNETPEGRKQNRRVEFIVLEN